MESGGCCYISSNVHSAQWRGLGHGPHHSLRRFALKVFGGPVFCIYLFIYLFVLLFFWLRARGVIENRKQGMFDLLRPAVGWVICLWRIFSIRPAPKASFSAKLTAKDTRRRKRLSTGSIFHTNLSHKKKLA